MRPEGSVPSPDSRRRSGIRDGAVGIEVASGTQWKTKLPTTFTAVEAKQHFEVAHALSATTAPRHGLIFASLRIKKVRDLLEEAGIEGTFHGSFFAVPPPV